MVLICPGCSRCASYSTSTKSVLDRRSFFCGSLRSASSRVERRRSSNTVGWSLPIGQPLFSVPGTTRHPGPWSQGTFCALIEVRGTLLPGLHHQKRKVKPATNPHSIRIPTYCTFYQIDIVLNLRIQCSPEVQTRKSLLKCISAMPKPQTHPVLSTS
jgi:hypothetical protein